MLDKAFLFATSFYFILVFSPKAYAQTDHWETVVYDNSVWKYIVPNASTSLNWIQPSFDAAAWSASQGGFGFGSHGRLYRSRYYRMVQIHQGKRT